MFILIGISPATLALSAHQYVLDAIKGPSFLTPERPPEYVEVDFVRRPEPPTAPDVDLRKPAPAPLPVPISGVDDREFHGPPLPPSLALTDEATDLILLGSTVKPGTSARLAWTPDVSINGLALPTPVLVVNGDKPGPTLCLTAAIHGDELNGIEIVRQVMFQAKPDKLHGRLIGIPIVNLQGFQRSSRYLPDRRDLNRHFPGSVDGSLASRIAHSLFTEVIIHCDALVDLHTGSMRRTNLPQVRADTANPEVAEFTRGFHKMVVVHSGGSAGMLRHAATEAGIPAVTLEMGESMRIQREVIDSGVLSLTALMERLDMIERFFRWGDPSPVYYDSRWVRAEQGGILFSEVELGDTIRPEQILGEVTDPITNEARPIRSPFRGRVIGMAVDQVVMPGFAAFHIGINPTDDPADVDTSEPVDPGFDEPTEDSVTDETENEG